MLSNTVACLGCGWVHFEMKLEEVELQVHNFNIYYDSQPKDKQSAYKRRASISDYTRCNRCGGSYKNFDEIDETNLPLGVTIGPILARAYDLSC